MNSQWILFTFLVLAILLAFDIILRATIEIVSSKNEKKLRKAMRQLRGSKQPRITVLVYGKNQSAELENTVRQVRKSQYSTFDIVAVSDRSNDDTALRMKQYVQKFKSQPQVQFLQRRGNGTKMDAYRAGYRKSQKGKIIICLTAGDEVDKLLLKRAAASGLNKQKWRVEISSMAKPRGLVGLVEKLQELFSHKPSSVRVFTSSALRRYNDSKQSSPTSLKLQTLLFTSIVIAMWYGGLMALWYVWVLFSLYLLALIWIHDETPLAEKWKISFSVPSALFLIPVTVLAEGVVQLRIRK